MKTSASDKINSLQRHLEKVKAQAGTVPERRKGQETAYKEWVSLEIKRTEAAIAKLKA